MPIWKKLLLNLYYHGTRPYRRLRIGSNAVAGTLPITVLFYHRVADDCANPWTISTETFIRQIQWLEARFELISLEEAQRRIRQGWNNRPCASITFDDGYAENCRDALPLLIRKRIPCTYFVSAGHVLDDVPFEHDLIRGDRFAPNSIEQLRVLATGGIEIGAHTRTHADLGRIRDPDTLYDELICATNDLEAAIDRPIRYFAFPFGQYANLSAAAFQLARQAGYRGVCSAYGGYNFPGDDGFHVQRFGAPHSLLKLKNLVTIDPRKLRTRRFFYGAEDTTPRRAGVSLA